MHARSGGNIEVMGLMQGKIQGDTMIIMDSFALPVEGTETRVNAAAEGYEYMVDYILKAKEVNRPTQHFFSYDSNLICLLCRWDDSRTRLGGIIVIRDMGVGFRV
jgi:proteasome lid subunit RPN8/RPN11